MNSLVRFATIALLCTRALAATEYPLGEDSQPQDGVPQGRVIKGVFAQSKVFPGTTRDYTIYVPQQLDLAKPAPFLVLQDGGGFQAVNVLNNLIHKEQIPAQVGIFVMHGRVKTISSNALDRFNRSYEYDGMGENYARFLIDELFPFLEQTHGIKLSTNAVDGAIGGASSGAICAFTAAWERPERFSRVFSSIGTYVGLRGGDAYPTLIRKMEPRPIRIFMQDGENDLNIYGGDWWMANQMMLRALQFSGYDVAHVWGDGGHDGKHATAVFPDALRWLWRDYPQPIVANGQGSSRQPIARLLDGGWELVSSGHGFTEGPAVNARGEVFFTDIPKSLIHKVSLNGTVSEFAEDTDGANGLMFGPDGRLYAAAGNRVMAYDERGKAKEIAELLPMRGGENAPALNDLAISQTGNIYATVPSHRQVWLIKPNGDKRVVDTGIAFPNGILLSPDQSLLFVADMRGQLVWSFQVQPDGGLAHKQPYHHLHQPDALEMSAADGMCVDTNGTLYVATAMGVQFCDQAGRVNGIISKPQRKWLANVVLGGPAFNELYACSEDKVFKRRLNTRGANSFQAPVKPATPRL